MQCNSPPMLCKCFDCYSLTSLGTIAIDTTSGLYLYPNPTKGILTLSSSTIEIKKVTITNTLGMVVGHSLDISSLANGMYIVSLETNTGFFVQKVIKE